MIVECTHPLNIGDTVKIAEYEIQSDNDNFIIGRVIREVTEKEYIDSMLEEENLEHKDLYKVHRFYSYFYEVAVD